MLLSMTRQAHDKRAVGASQRACATVISNANASDAPGGSPAHSRRVSPSSIAETDFLEASLGGSLYANLDSGRKSPAFHVRFELYIAGHRARLRNGGGT